jgi:hypothetical protein
VAVDGGDRSASYAPDAVIHGAEVPASRPVIDDKKPTTKLQLRLHNGQRVTETLNLDHTVRDLHAIIQLCVYVFHIISLTLGGS